MYNCIIFDVDGTLMDTEAAVYASYKKVFKELLNRDFGPENMKVCYGVPTRQAIANFCVKNIEEFCNAYVNALLESYNDVNAFEGVFEMLDEVKNRNLVTGIVTSRNKTEVYEDLRLTKIKSYMKYIVCSNDTEKHKPDPEPVFKFLELSGADNKKTIYLGDTIFDANCAAGANVPFALALWGAKNPENIKADYYLEKPGDLLKIL